MNFRCSGTELQTPSASVLIKTAAAQAKWFLILDFYLFIYFFSCHDGFSGDGGERLGNARSRLASFYLL